MKNLALALLAILCCCCQKPNAQNMNRSEKYQTRDGKEITFHFYGHASLSIETDGKFLYFDPVSQYGDFSKGPKANVLFITHCHFDHFEADAIDALSTKSTTILIDSTSAATMKGRAAKESTVKVMAPGNTADILDGIHVEAIPAYNMTEGHLQFHPRVRKDCGYILTIGGSRILIAGDTENTPELKALKNIDIAFLPVNQPYTMTVDQALDVIKAIRPKIFYPYHYGGTKTKTDMKRLETEAKVYTDVRIKGME